MNAFLTHVATETRLLLRNGEQLLLTLGIPVGLLVFFSTVNVYGIDGNPVATMTPGILALAIMSTAMVGLGIATGFERKYGVLKLLGITPFGRPRLLLAKASVIAVVEILQFVVLTIIAVALGWRPTLSPLVFVAILLGSGCFAGIGLTLAGRLKGEINLAAVNALYLLLLLFGGMAIPFSKLPTPLRTIGQLLPSGALSEVLKQSVADATFTAQPWLVLLAWTVLSLTAAATLFRWE
jgi:ABC-2 type transport system permease protein